MLSRSHAFIGLLSALFLLQGCDNPDVSNRDLGRLVGGIAGASIGNSAAGSNKTLGTVVGALAGSYIGGEIGKDIDKKNQQKMAWVLETKPSSRSVAWKDPDAGSRYEMVPEPSFRRGTTVCRRFKLVVYMDGRRSVRRGVACRTEGRGWIVD